MWDGVTFPFISWCLQTSVRTCPSGLEALLCLTPPGTGRLLPPYPSFLSGVTMSQSPQGAHASGPWADVPPAPAPMLTCVQELTCHR